MQFDLRKFLIENKLTQNSQTTLNESWTEDKIRQYLQVAYSKYADRPFSGMKGGYRKIQDNIVLLKNRGGWPITELVEHITNKQGFIKRSQVVWEHRTPLNLYQRELHQLFQAGKLDEVYKLLYDKTDFVLVHRVEDLLLSKNGFTCKIPAEGERYENCGIILSNKILKPSQLKEDRMRRAAKVRIAAEELKDWYDRGFITIIDEKLTIDYSVDI